MVELIFDKDEDWEKRILCIDESCVGTIGPDGRCRECGKPYDGSLIPAAVAADTNKEPAAPVDNLKTNTESAIPDEEWEKRVLCSDETCIGTIGPDGKCRECGKPSK
jgi:hypothetical protein